MELKDVKRNISTKRNVPLSIKITDHLSSWLNDQRISPTALFVKAAEELGYKTE